MGSLKFYSLTLLSLFLIACGNDSAPTSNQDFNTDLLVKAEKTSQNEILNAINKARSVARDCHDGLGIVPAAPALTWNSELYTSAYEHSSDLAKSNTFSHYGSGTTSDVTGSSHGKKSYFIDRIEANGYVDYSIIGENIAGGHTTIQLAIEAWIASPTHCTNLMNKSFTEVGVAVVTNSSSDYGIYWTQSFGSKK